MKFLYLLLPVMLLSLAGCKKDVSPQEIPQVPSDTVMPEEQPEATASQTIYGKTFRNIYELPQFKNYSDMGGGLIGTDSVKNHDYAIAHYYSKANTFCALQIVVRAKNGKAMYRLLDTVNAGVLSQNEIITYNSCMRDTTFDQAIIAVVNMGSPETQNDSEYFKNVVKAWRADITTGKIVKIKDVKRIKCANEGYYAD